MKNVFPQAKILNKLSLSKRDHLIHSIIHHYQDRRWIVVHFLYFASLLTILKGQEKKDDQSLPYSQALISADFLLPDGIALALYYEYYLRQSPIKWFEVIAFMTHFSHLALPNNNGTDFIPSFLDALEERWINYSITLLSAYDTNINKPKTAIQSEIETLKQRWKKAKFVSGYNVEYQARNNESFRKELWKQQTLQWEDDMNVLMVATGSPHQELWVEANKEFLKEQWYAVFTVGGLIDFLSGREKRAPHWMRNIKLEWLYRACVNPKKNKKKALSSFEVFKYIRR
jgi:exopolysaccharide biosynthesis WecB/TagA/CpsF family protein